MNTKRSFKLLIMLIGLSVSACAPQSASKVTDTDCIPSRIVRCTSPIVQVNPADRFTGTWTGTMSFSDDANRKEDVIVTILPDCAAGDVCGASNNITVSCTWEITLETVNADVFEYNFSKTLSGDCPALGGGTLTLQSDGTLMREHITPYFTASGVLTR
jgi:hypothetical protein